MEAKLTQRLVNGLKPTTRKFDVHDSETHGLTVRVLPSGNMTFYVRYSMASKQKWFKIGNANALSVKQAQSVAEMVNGDVAHGIDPQEKRRAARAHTLRSFVKQEFEPWALANRKSGHNMVARVKTAFATLLDKKLADIGALDVDRLRSQWVKQTGVKGRGSRHIAVLKSLFSRAVEWKHLEQNPIKSVKLAKTDAAGKIRILTHEEEQRLWAALDAREQRIRVERRSHNLWCRARHLPEWPDLDAARYADYLKPMIMVLLHSGLRRGEVFSLQWADVDLVKHTLTVRGVTAKSGKTRTVPLNAVALDALTAWRAQSPQDAVLVFPSPATGRRFDNINGAWRAIMRDAGITNLRTHDLRHTFASRCVASGADIQTVRELLGHSSISTTSIYLHSRAADKVAAVDRLVPRDNVVHFAAVAQKE